MSTNSPTIKHFTLLALTVAMSTLGASNRSGAAMAADDADRERHLYRRRDFKTAGEGESWLAWSNSRWLSHRC